MISYLIIKKSSRVPRILLTLLASLLISSSFIFFSSACRLYNLEKKLGPVNAEFLSQVRYIITKKERKIFLELPDSEKEAFIEEFWELRDPDPGTEENEFKLEYFDRIERANELFVSEAIPGWLTDRGRIYILFGPPFERLTYPMGDNPESRCQEIWYYGGFPVVFVDTTCTGQYKLITYNLTSLNDMNLLYMHELNKAQDHAQQTMAKEKDFFDFDWKVKKNITDTNTVEGTIFIEIPYKGIWFNAEEDKLHAILDIQLELKDFENNLVWEYAETLEFALTDEELREKKKEKYTVEIPINLNEELNRLRLGKNILHAVVKNRTGDQEIKKVMEFRF